MPSFFRRLSLATPLALLVAVFITSCQDDPSGPLAPIHGSFALAPAFQSSVAGIVDLVNVRVEVIRTEDSAVALDTLIRIPTDADSLDLSLPVLLRESDELFSITMYFITPAGDTAFVGGPIAATATSSRDAAPVPVDMPIVYVGVGHDAASVQITTTGASVLSGDTVVVNAVALTDQGEVIPGTPIGWSSLDTLMAHVPDEADGRVVGGSGRGPVAIAATLLTGPADTGSVNVVPLPSTLTVETGADQVAEVATQLVTPLAVTATASDGLAVEGVTLVFETTDSGTFTADSVVTGTDGRAETSWTLGTTAGTQTTNVTVPKAAGVSTTVTATGLAAAADSIAIVAGDNQGAVAGQAVAVAPSVVVTDRFGNPTPDEGVTFLVTAGGGRITGASATTDASGIATVGSWTLGTTAGTNELSASVNALAGTPVAASGRDSSSAADESPSPAPATLGSVTFTATGSAGAATILTGVSGDAQTDTVAATLADSLLVLATDNNDNQVAGQEIEWLVVSGGGTPSASNTTTGAAGQTGIEFTLGTTAGAHVVQAIIAGADTVEFNLTGDPATPAELMFTLEPPDTAARMPFPVEVRVHDGFGNLTTNNSSTSVSVAIDPNTGTTGAVLSGTASVTASAGVASFPDLSVDLPGPAYQLVATATGIAPDTSLAFDITQAPTAFWTNPSGGNWSDGANWSTGVAPGASDTASITLDGTYTVTLDENRTVAQLVLGATTGTQTLTVASRTLTVEDTGTVGTNGVLALSGTLNGAGTVVVSGVVNWSGGTMGGSGVTRIASGAVLNKSATTTLTGRALENAGTFNWTNGNFTVADGASIDNQVGATFDIQTNANFSVSGTVPAFNNEGLLLYSSPGFQLYMAMAIDNIGTFDIQNATVEMNADLTTTGTVTIGDGATLRLNSSSALDNTVTIGAGGLLDFPGSSGPHPWPGGFAPSGDGSVSVNTTVTMGSVATDTVWISRLTHSGTLDGPATLVITDVLNWSGGTIGGSGVLSIPDTVVLNKSATTTLTGRALENAGTFNWTNGNFTVADGASIDNQVGATFDIQTNANFSVSGTVPAFNNEGLLLYSSSGFQLYMAMAIDNIGTFDIQNATVEMNADLTTTGTVTIGDGATLRLNSSSALDNTVTIGAGGLLDFPGSSGPHPWPGGFAPSGDGSVSVNTTVTMGSVATDTVWISRLTHSGTLDGPATLVITDVLNWSGGTIGGSGVLSIPDTVVLNKSATTTLTGRALENAGTFNWTNGNFTVADGASIDNQVGATFDIQTNANFSVSGTVPAFNNEGLLLYSSPGFQLYMAMAIDNIGTFEIQNATVEMNADLTTTGTVTIGDGATLRLNSSSALDNTVTIGAGGLLDFPGSSGPHPWPGGFAPSGDGSVSVNTTVTMGSVATDTVWISRLTHSGTLDGPATLVITDVLNWSGGTIGGSGVLSIPDTVVLNKSATTTLTGRALENAGTFNWTNGNFTVADGASIDNQVGATFDIQTNANFSVSGTVPAFNNEGLLLYSSSGFQLYMAMAIDNIGTFDIQNATVEMNADLTTTGTVTIGDGATLRLNSSSALDNTVTIGAGGLLDFPGSSGPHPWPGGFAPNGDGSVSVNTTITMGSVGTDTVWISRLNHSGVLDGPATLMITDVLNWSGGTIGGSGVLSIPDTVVLNKSATTTLTGRALENAGTFNWTNGNFTVADGASIDNQVGATFDIQTNANFSVSGTVPAFNNEGLLLYSSSGFQLYMAMAIDNIGTFDIQNATVEMNADLTTTGTVTIGDGATLRLNSSSALDNTVTIGAGGLLDFPGSSGPHPWPGGFAPNGDGSVSVNTTITMGSVGTDTVWISRLNHSGVLDGPATLMITDVLNWTGGTIGGSGVLSIPDTAVLNKSATTTLTGRALENAGTFNWTNGNFTVADGASIDNQIGATFDIQTNANFSVSGTVPAFNNEGLLLYSSPGFELYFNPPIDNIGTFEILSATVVMSDEFNHADGAILQGSGTLNLTGATVSAFDGDVNPGTSPGLLSITGPLGLGATTGFNVELGGTTVGTEYDRLAVGGAATLDGAINLSLIDLFVPSAADTFVVMTFASSTGEFADTTGLPANFAVVTTATEVLVVDTTATAAPVSWTNPAGGDWSVGTNWNTGTPPSAADTAVIDLDGTYTVTLGENVTVDQVTLGALSGTITLSTGVFALAATDGMRINSTSSVSLDGAIVVTGASYNYGNIVLNGTGLNLDILAASFLNDGTIDATNGSLTVTQSGPGTDFSITGYMTVGTDQTVSIDGGTFTYGAPVDGFGTLSLSNLTADVQGLLDAFSLDLYLTNVTANGGGGIFTPVGGGTLTLDGSTINVLMDNRGTMLSLNANTVSGAFINAGTLDVQTGSIAFTGNFTHADDAVLQGSGTVDIIAATVLAFDGDENPGTASPGELSVTGDLPQSALSTINIELGGTTVGTEYDRLTVSGAATLDGTINLSLIDAFVPSAADTFVVMTFASSTGEFADTTGLPANFAVVKTATEVLVVDTVNASGQNSWTGDAGDGLWSSAGNWSLDRAPLASDTARIELDGTYTVTLDVDATVSYLALGGTTGAQTLSVGSGTWLTIDNRATVSTNGVVELDGGTVTGDGAITIAGTMNWNSGRMMGAGTSAISSGGALNLTAGEMTARELQNNGTVTWSGGTLTLLSGASIYNGDGALFDMQGDDLLDTDGAGMGFTNAGTLRRSSGTGTVEVSPPLQNTGTGTIDIQTGSVRLWAEFIHDAGAVLQGSGTLDLSSATILDFNGDVRPGGTSPGILNITGDLVPSVASTITIELDGVTAGTEYDRLNVSGQASLNGTIDVTTGFTPSAGDTFAVVTYGSRGGTLSDLTLPDISPLVWDTVSTTGSTPDTLYLIANNAPPVAVNWTGAGNGTSWSDADNWSSAPALPGPTNTVYIDQDAVAVSLDTDAQVLALEVTGVGTSLSQSAYTLTIDSSATIGADAVYDQSGGTLTGAGNVTIEGQMDWGGGIQSGTGVTTIAAGGKGTWYGDAKTLDTRPLFVQDTVTWTAGTLYLETGATLYNDAAIELQNAAEAYIWSGTLGIFDNQGTFRKSGAGSTNIGGAVLFNSDDSLVVDEGTLTVSAEGDTHDGPFVVAAGATLDFAGGTHALNGDLTGSGVVDFSTGATVSLAASAAYSFPALLVTGGAATFNGPVTISDSIRITVGSATFETLAGDITVPLVVQSGGTLTGSNNFIVTDSLSWSGGWQTGSGTTTVAADAGAWWSGGTKTLDTRTLTLAGTLWWTGGYLSMAGDATFENNGTVELQAATAVSLGGSGTVANNGVFRDAGDGDSYVSVPFYNAGSLIVEGGSVTLNPPSDTYDHAGTFAVSAGATLDFAGGTHSLSDNLTGLGVVDIGTSVTLAPTASYDFPGLLVTAGTATFNGPVTISDSIRLGVGTLTFDTPATDITVPRFVHVNGTLTGPDNLIVTDSLIWNTGTQSGSGATTIAAGGAGLWDGGAKTLNTRSLTIADTVLWTAGNLNLANSASITNFGVVELQNTDGASLSGVGSFMNNGLFRKSQTGYSAISTPLTNSNTLEVLAGGTLNINGTITHAVGAAMTGGGTIDISGDLTVNGNVSVNTLAIGGALTAGTGSYSVVNTTFDGGGQTMPVLPYTNILVASGATGTFSNASPITVTGDVVAGGTVAIAGATVTVNGEFRAEVGRLSMVNAAGTLSVLGNASFIGMSTSGFLTAGTLVLGGNFVQENLMTSDQSFAASGSHTTLFNGTGPQGVYFANPDSLTGSGSHFGFLLVEQQGGSLTLDSRVFADSVEVDDNLQTVESVVDGAGELISRGPFTTLIGDYGVDIQPAAVRLGHDLSIQGTFRPMVTEFFGSGGQGVPDAAYNDVIASGMTTWFGDISIGGSLYVTGSAMMESDGSFNLSIDGDMIVSGNGWFSTAPDCGVGIDGNLITQDQGVVSIGASNEGIRVSGDATFEGGNSTGSMSGGTLRIGGDFTQLSTNSSQSFAPSPEHLTILDGTAAQQVSFASPSLSESRFGNLRIDNSSVGGVVLDTDLFVYQNLLTEVNTITQTLFGQGNTITAHGMNSWYLAFHNLPLVIAYDGDYSAVTSMIYTTFQNMTDGVTQFSLSRASGDLGVNETTFDESATGLFIHVTDTDEGSDLSVNFNCSTPADLTGRILESGTASVTFGCIN